MKTGRRTWAAYCRSIDVLRKWSSGAVISIHHSGHKECQRERGHSKLRADADTMISVVRTENGMVIKNIKQKDAEEFPAYTLNTQNVLLGDVSSLVLGWGGTVKEQKSTDRVSAEIDKLSARAICLTRQPRRCDHAEGTGNQNRHDLRPIAKTSERGRDKEVRVGHWGEWETGQILEVFRG